MAAFLLDIGRRHVDGDSLGRQRQAKRLERRADALPAFAHRFVRQSHYVEGDDTAGKLDLNVDIQDFNALEGHRIHPRNQRDASRFMAHALVC